MKPRLFYPINEKNYLFGMKSEQSIDAKKVKKTRHPEEAVRQWAIFELLSTYGISINSIRVEYPVRDHSTNYRADIVILHDDKPYIVIECKRPYNNNINKVLRQAQIYASDLKAEFAVYTDGHDWKVTRSVVGKWIPVGYIPREADTRVDDTITDTLWFLQSLKPLAFWIHRQVPESYAHRFFSLMQEFFAGHIVGLKGYDIHLTHGTELLLRVIVGCFSNEGALFKIGEYEDKTMRAAFLAFSEYLKGIGYTPADREFVDLMEFRELFVSLWKGFDELAKNHEVFTNGDVDLVRLVLALLQYLNETLQPGSHNQRSIRAIHPSLVDEFEKFVEPILISKVNLRFPRLLDANELKSFRIITSDHWTNEGEMP